MCYTRRGVLHNQIKNSRPVLQTFNQKIMPLIGLSIPFI